MNALLPYFHSYALCLLKPKLMLDWMRFGIAPYADDNLPYPEVGVQIGISWSFSIIQGLSRIVLANLMMHLFIHFQNKNDFFYALVDVQDGLFPFYFLLFTTALDLVFFPIVALITTELWNFILKFYANRLQVEGDRDGIVRDITSVALSSNFFLVVPIIGVVFQKNNMDDFALYRLSPQLRGESKFSRFDPNDTDRRHAYGCQSFGFRNFLFNYGLVFGLHFLAATN